MVQQLSLLFVGLLLSANTSLAGGMYNADFGDLDANADKLVVKEEFTGHFKDTGDPGEAFDLIDADKSGGIDSDEWQRFTKAHGSGSMGGMKGMKMEGMPGMEGMKNPHGLKSMDGIKK